jgi:hypothetical protein
LSFFTFSSAPDWNAFLFEHLRHVAQLQDIISLNGSATDQLSGEAEPDLDQPSHIPSEPVADDEKESISCLTTPWSLEDLNEVIYSVISAN